MKNRPLFSRKLLKGAYKKFLRPSLEAITGFAADGPYKLMLTYIDSDTKEQKRYEAVCTLNDQNNKHGVEFKISIEEQLRNGGVKYLNSYGLQDAFQIYNDTAKLIADSGAIQNFECDFPALPRQLTGYLDNLRTQRKPYDNSYFRMCIPVGDTDILYPADIIHSDLHLVFDVRQWDMQPSLIGIRFPSIKGMCVELEVRQKRVHLYAVEDIKWIFIDSLEKNDFTEFKDIAADIRLAFGFLTARYYSGDVFILTSKDKHFKKISDVIYRLERDQINGKQQLINPTQLFQFYQHFGSEQFKKKFHDFHDRLPATIFGNFCSTLINPELRRATEILVNACSIKEPLQQGILASVALETITELVAEENEQTIKPIPNKQLAKALIKRLKEVVKDEFDGVPIEGQPVIDSKLSDLNKPTNRGKLLFPFKHYGLNLTQSEENMLDHRNDFLHGRTPNGTESDWELEQIALRLHYLAGIVILKYIGYSGHVMNLPFWNLFSHQERMTKIFPIENEQLKEIAEKVTKGQEISEEDSIVLEHAGNLSLFIENIIKVI